MLIYNVMLGKHNSILSRVLEKTDAQLQVFTWGASPYCKIVHTIIGVAGRSLALPVDNFLIDSFYFFNSRYI